MGSAVDAGSSLIDRHRALVVASIQFVVLSIYSLARHAQFLTAGYDLGIFDQAVRAYSRFRAPLVALKGDDFNILGDHFHPIIAVLAPFYWIWDDPRVLLLAQAALLSISTVIVWRFADRKLGSGWATVLSTGYALGWPLQAMVDFDFHEIAFAIPLIAWAIDALDRRSDRDLLTAGCLLLFVREDLGALVLILGLLRTVRRPRWPGVLIAGLGAVAFAVVVRVVVPHFSRAQSYAYWDYPDLGPDMGSALHSIGTRPWHAVALLVSPEVKLHTILALLIPVLLLPLFSRYGLLAVPILVERLFSGRATLWGAEFHYNAPVWVILFLGAIAVLGSISARRRRWLLRGLLVTLVIAPVAAMSFAPGSIDRLLPLARMVSGKAFHVSAHLRDQASIVAAVPRGTCVVADDRLVPHLTRTNVVTVFGMSQRHQDFYALDLSQARPSLTPHGELTADVLVAVEAQGYKEVMRSGAVILLQAPDHIGRTAECTP